MAKRVVSRPVSTKSAGKVVESSVPKNGTIATRPVKIPKGNQNGTSSSHRPTAVSAPRKLIASSCPTM